MVPTTNAGEELGVLGDGAGPARLDVGHAERVEEPGDSELVLRVNIYYAMKANPAPRIIETLARRGASFDTASAGEIETLARMGILGTRMIYANPVKTPQELTALFGVGASFALLSEE